MSRLAVVKDPRFQDHQTPPGHPESPQRVSAINHAIESADTNFSTISPRLVLEDELTSTHSPSYIEDLTKKAKIAENTGSLISIDPDTVMSPKTFETAKLASGAALSAIDSLKAKDHDSAFVAVRPPGHHALKDRAMGFCLFNNVAIAARYAIEIAGYKRVFILDWDVHHGNGTQDIFYNQSEIMFVSLHQHPFWPPGSGTFDEPGTGEGKGFNLNIPLPEGTGDTGYLQTLDQIVVPVCSEFNPDLILVSAGYDAHQEDFIAGQNITTVGFAMMSQRIADLRDNLGANVLCLLEGGYNVHALSRSALATMEVLNARGAEELGRTHASYMVADAVTGAKPVTEDDHPETTIELIEVVKKKNKDYWKNLN